MKKFGKMTIHTAGVTFDNRQGKLLNARKYSGSIYVTLRREKNNENDPKAIAVLCHIPETATTFKAGYIPKNSNYWLADAMDNGRIIRTSKAAIVGGYSGRSYGLHFDIAYELPEKADATSTHAQTANA